MNPLFCLVGSIKQAASCPMDADSKDVVLENSPAKAAKLDRASLRAKGDAKQEQTPKS
jgi:hypothetical protein